MARHKVERCVCRLCRVSVPALATCDFWPYHTHVRTTQAHRATLAGRVWLQGRKPAAAESIRPCEAIFSHTYTDIIDTCNATHDPQATTPPARFSYNHP